MKTTALISAALLSATTLSGANQPAVTTTLSDGSVVKGELRSETFNGSSIFMDALSIPAEKIRGMTFANTNGEAKVVLTNGDTFAFRLSDSAVKVTSSLGELSIPVAKINKMALTMKASAGGDDGLVFACSFEGRKSIPGKVNHVEFTEGRDGKGLLVKRGLSACEIELPAGTLGSKGCIEFWASMCDGKTEFTTGGDPRFFTLYKSSGAEVGVMEYASNNGLGNGGIWASLPLGHAYSNSGFSQMVPYSAIFHGKPYEGWHHYAVVWNSEGISSGEAGGRAIAIFIDGRIVTPSAQINNSRNALSNFDSITNLSIPMKFNGPSYNNKSTFIIDELKIWNYDKIPAVGD